MSRNKRKSSPTVESYRARAYQYLVNHPDETFSLKKLSRKLNFKNKIQRQNLAKAMELLYEKGKIDILKNGDYVIEGKETERKTKGGIGVLEGILDLVNPRFGFVVIEGMDNDIKISSNGLKGAWDGDRVSVKMTKQASRGRNPEGEVIEIIERARTEFVGRIEVMDSYAFVIPDNRKLHDDIFVAGRNTKDAETGQKVIVAVTEWPEKGKKAEGKVVKVLGEAGSNDVEMHAILLEFGLPYDFPSDVIIDAENIPDILPEKEIKARRDMRNVTTFTIDPVDAKDFDDALSIRLLDDEKKIWEIGVHIADVTYYVKPDSKLEEEAYKRATSVYLVDRVVPMLPEKLSNGLCSLRPNEDKFTFSAVFEMDETGKILKEWFGRTVIHSDHRFAYEDAQEVLDGNIDGPYKEELLVLNKIAYALRDKRFKNGSIKFETTEVRFKLDEDAKPLEVVPKIRKDAHRLIEDFMLLANKKVAEFVHFKDRSDPLTMVFRTHDDPDPEKLLNFKNFAYGFGHNLDLAGGNIAKELNAFVDDVENKPEGSILQDIAIRAMSKAVYTTAPTGHFGLAFPYYTHFTSPIRRYPDMMVHRLLQRYLDNESSADKNDYENKCKHSSMREKLAAEAERASIKYKQAEFMLGMIGEVFSGIISGVTEWGMYVEIEATKCEGMVRISDMVDDTYIVDKDNYRIVGKNDGKMYKFGDRVWVEVIDANLGRRTIDLELAEEPEDTSNTEQ